MSSAVSKLIVAIMMLAFPSLLKMVVGTMSVDPMHGGSFSELTSAAQNMTESMVSIMGVMAYVSGLIMGVSALMEFKRYADGDVVYSSDLKSIEEESINQETVIVSENNLDFENEELNKLMNSIRGKAKQLKENAIVKTDIESLLLVEKSEYDYIKKIHDSYISIPLNKRRVLFKKKNPFDMAKDQLNMLLDGLDNVENKIVEHAMFNQQVNEKFLKEKMTSI